MSSDQFDYNGTNDFIKELYLRYSEQIYAYLMSQTLDSEKTKDILQEVFLIALQKEEALQQSPNQLGWLYQTAKYCVYRQWAKRKKDDALIKKIASEQPQEYNLCFEEMFFEDSELFQKLRQCLNEKEYQYICNRFVQDMSLKTIAAKEKKSISAVTSFGNRIFNKIRSVYNQPSSAKKGGMKP